MSLITFQITSLTLVYSTVYSGADQRTHQSSASLAFVWGIYRWPVNSPYKWTVTRKMFPFDDVIMHKICVISIIKKQIWLGYHVENVRPHLKEFSNEFLITSSNVCYCSIPISYNLIWKHFHEDTHLLSTYWPLWNLAANVQFSNASQWLNSSVFPMKLPCRGMPDDFADDTSTWVLVLPCWLVDWTELFDGTKHYLTQFWSKSRKPYGVAMPQRIKRPNLHMVFILKLRIVYCSMEK